MPATLQQLTANLAGKARKETLDGRDYLVVPLSMIVPGVLLLLLSSTCVARVAPECRYPDRLATHLYYQGVTTGSNVMATGVYCIRNKRNGKVYVGSSATSLRKRRLQHLNDLRQGKHSNGHLQKAWNKYGKSCFKFCVLERCLPGMCIECEQKWMDYYESYDSEYGYNISPTAGSTLGVKFTEEAKKKISKKAKGREMSEETRAKISAALSGVPRTGKSLEALDWTGRKHSEETLKRMRRKIFSAETRRKMSESGRRKKLTPEHKAKIAEAGRGRKHSEETLKKMRGQKRSAETRRKISASQKGKPKNRKHAKSIGGFFS